MSVSPSTSCSVAELKRNEELANVPDSQLLWLIEKSTCQVLEVGEKLFCESFCADENAIQRLAL